MIEKRFTFGTRNDPPENASENRVLPFILSTTTRDRHGTVLNQDGWNLDNYRKNPIVAYQHNLYGDFCSGPDPDNVIGKSVMIDIDGDKGMRRLIADAEFEPREINALAGKIFEKLLFGSLRTTSVGFMEVGRGKYGEDEEREGGAAETYYFEGQELVEWSVVNIPSNPDATKRSGEVKRFVREQSAAAIMYAYREMGHKFRLSELEQMRVGDLLSLLDGKSLEIKEADPEKVAEMVEDPIAQRDMADLIEEQQKYARIRFGLQG